MKRLLLILFSIVWFATDGTSQSKTKLKEVVVRPNLRKVVLGTGQDKAEYGHGGAPGNPKYQTAFFVPSKGLKGFIDKIGIYIYHKHTFLEFLKPSNPLNLYLYEINSRGLPGKMLLPEPLVIKPVRNTYWHWEDISKYNITLPEQGVFAAVSWPKATKQDSGPYVGMTNECEYCPFYVYHLPADAGNNWVKVDKKLRKSLSKKKSKKFNQNLMVRLEVSVK